MGAPRPHCGQSKDDSASAGSIVPEARPVIAVPDEVFAGSFGGLERFQAGWMCPATRKTQQDRNPERLV